MLMPEVYSLIFFLYIIGLGFLSNFFLQRIDTKALLKSQEESHSESFIAERAYRNLKILNDFGPKVVGSRANEVLATNFILQQIEEVKGNASFPKDIFIDRQITTGYNFRSWNYANLQNIVVRVQGETDHAVMLNCHFDSVPGSPGASDDIVNCCTMLEIYRVLTKSPQKQKHTIIFLFNGSEESNLQAAHGFITQQKWRKDVKAYINLESTGSGGKEILFRTGPKHDWLVKMYRESVPRPFGHAISEELFEAGYLPSATDFQIFRDYGEIPGLDFAYVKDGWRYHTRYDSIDYISMESVQHTGNNILALTKKIANSDELADPPEGTSAIYFEYLGLIFISYTATAGVVTNYIVSILAFLIPFIILTKFRMEKIWFVSFETIISFVTMIISFVLSALACYGMAEIMNLVDNTMSWFSTTFISIGIYGSLVLIVQIGTYHVMQLISELCNSKKFQKVSQSQRVKISLNSVTLCWSFLTIVITAFGLRSAYLLMILSFSSLCTFLLTYIVCKLLPKTWSQIWIIFHIFGQSIVFLFMCYIWLQIHQLYIPIGAKIFVENPDTNVALILFFWVTLCLSYFIPLTRLIRFRAALYSLLSIIFIVSIILAFTSVGFPYSGDKSAPKVQRFQAAHTKNTYFDSDGNIKWFENFVTIHPIDRNGLKTIKKVFKTHEIKELSDSEYCMEFKSCQHLAHLRLYASAVRLADINVAPNIMPTKYNLIQSTKKGNYVDIEFTLELRTLIYFSLELDDGLVGGSSTISYSEVKKLEKRYLTGTITSGIKTNESYHVKFTLLGTPTSEIFAKLIIATEDSTFDQGEITPEYKAILNEFPDYTFSQDFQFDISTYEIREF